MERGLSDAEMDDLDASQVSLGTRLGITTVDSPDLGDDPERARC